MDRPFTNPRDWWVWDQLRRAEEHAREAERRQKEKETDQCN